MTEPYSGCHSAKADQQKKPVHKINGPERLVHICLIGVDENFAEYLSLRQNDYRIEQPDDNHD